ncbi:hypothetical protein [Bosea sp. RAC05]|uniref:hypothetical protein n=1 Tax=Bosea sp. RAC05 TaxID=1842539 RepID=UPI00083D4249|nr:hypothetical protein [Bosea sp. RAC05]AOG03025.1 putative integral membrane protein [Bosea sp. RAC05]
MAVGLKNNRLIFEFPEIHPDAVLEIDFHRTNRLPEDAHVHSLPPSLGSFPLRDIHDLPKDKIPANWLKRGGIVLPMHQTEAMWMSFHSPGGYPMAVKVCVGKVNAVTGKPWSEDLAFGDDQDFMQVPGQMWMDGICIGKGVIRQFVAMPLGQGYTVEGQVTGKEDHGGLQILVKPLLPAHFTKVPKLPRRASYDSSFAVMASGFDEPGVLFSAAPSSDGPSLSPSSFKVGSPLRAMASVDATMRSPAPRKLDMGLAAGGQMKQEIYVSPIEPQHWSAAKSRCFVAIANAESWADITGTNAPALPESYATHVSKGGKVFEVAETGHALEGGAPLKGVKSLKAHGETIGENPLPVDVSVDPASVKTVKVYGNLPISGAKLVSEGVI